MPRRAACTASASAWSTRCRPRRSSRSRATRSSIARPSRAAMPTSKLVEARRRRRTGAAPPVTFTPDPQIFGEDGAVQAGAALPAGAVQGLSVRRRRDTLALRSRADRATRRPAEAVFQFPGGLADHLKEQIGDARMRDHRVLHRQAGFPERPGLGRMGGRLAALERRQRLLLLQHHPDPGRRHPRAGPARRADPRHARLRRAGRPEEGEGHPGRGRADRRRDHAVGLHPRSAVPEPDQGPADLARRRAAGRESRCATISTISSPTIWTAGARCSASCSTGWTSG